MPHKVEISHRTIIFTVFFLIFIWFLYYILDIILLLFVAILLATILNPAIKKLNRYKIPRGLAVIIVYLTVAALAIFSIGTILNPLVEQTGNFAVNFPIFLERLQIPRYLVEQVTTEITSEIGSISSQILKIGVSIFSNILTVFALLIISLYLSIARGRLGEQLRIVLNDEQSKKFEATLEKLETDLGGWTRGEILLIFLVGISTYLGLSLLKIPYAVPLAALAGLLEGRLDRGPAVPGPGLQDVLHAPRREMQARPHRLDLRGVAGPAYGLGLAGGATDQARVGPFLVGRAGIALVAAGAARGGVDVLQEGGLHQVALVGFPRRGRGAASALPRLGRGRIWRR